MLLSIANYNLVITLDVNNLQCGVVCYNNSFQYPLGVMLQGVVKTCNLITHSDLYLGVGTCKYNLERPSLARFGCVEVPAIAIVNIIEFAALRVGNLPLSLNR